MNCIILPELEAEQNEYVLDNQSQINHILKVLKLNIGDTLKVGSLSGRLGTALISEVHNGIDNDALNKSSQQHHNDKVHRILLTDISCNKAPPPKLDLTIVLAMPRPKVLRRLIMDMTAVGVPNIILVNSYRTDKSYWQSPMLNRIDEFIIEGLQQGVDTMPPTISLKKRFKPFVEDELSLLVRDKQAVVAHPYAQDSLKEYQLINGLPQILCIGAEGGWINFEVDLFKKNGCDVVGLGSRILRTEAAVNALCGRYL